MAEEIYSIKIEGNAEAIAAFQSLANARVQGDDKVRASGKKTEQDRLDAIHEAALAEKDFHENMLAGRRERDARNLARVNADLEAASKKASDIAIISARDAGLHVENRLGRVADAFKSISRDVGVFGGQFSEVFARGADDALSMATAIGGGGLLGAVSGLTLAVAAGSYAWSVWEKETKTAEAAAKAFTESVKKERDALAKNQKDASDKTRLMTREEFSEAQKTAAATRAQWEAEAKALKALVDYKSGQRRAESKEELAIKKAAFKELDAELARQDKIVADQRVLRQEETRNSVNQQNVDVINAQEAARQEAAKKRKEEAAALRKEHDEQADAAMVAAVKYQRDMEEQARKDGEKRKADGIKKRAEDDAAAEEKAKKEQAIIDAAIAQQLAGEKAMNEAKDKAATAEENARAAREAGDAKTPGGKSAAAVAHTERVAVITEAKIRADELVAIKEAEANALKTLDEDARDAAIENAHAVADERIAASRKSTDKEIADIKRKRHDEEVAARIALYSSTVDKVKTETMQAMAPVLDMVTSKVAALGELNSANAADMLKLSNDTPAIMAKMAQGILAGIAAQAVGKSAMAAADAVAEGAKGVAAAADPLTAALAPGFFAGAAAYAAAAAGYAAIAGAGAGGAIGIGLARPLTNAEKKNAELQRGMESGPSSGGGSGIGNAGSSGPAVTQVSIVYGAGSVAPDDRRRSTQVIAEATARAQRNPFYQLANGVGQ